MAMINGLNSVIPQGDIVALSGFTSRWARFLAVNTRKGFLKLFFEKIVFVSLIEFTYKMPTRFKYLNSKTEGRIAEFHAMYMVSKWNATSVHEHVTHDDINLGYILNTYNAFEFGTHRWRKKISPNCDRAFYDRRRKQINPDNLTRISNFGKRNLGPTSRGKALE
jgi:hypothetical protein